MLFTSVILLVDVIFIGFLITYFFRIKLWLEARIVAGGLLGIIFFAVFILAASYVLGLGSSSLMIVLGVGNLFAVGYGLRSKIHLDIKKEYLDLRKRYQDLSWKAFLLFIGVVVLIFDYLAAQLLIFKNGSFFVQPVHSYGDISLHLGLISSFAFGNNFPPQSPILSGTKISYPFLVDFITAIFVHPLGLRFDQAVGLVGVFLMTILIILLGFFALKVIGNKLAAVLVITLFFFNGGLGFLFFFEDLQKSNLNFFQFFQALPKDYTALKELGFFWINVVLSMLLPQRSFLLGLPVVILILYIFWDLAAEFDKRKLILGLLLISLLPIIHAHSLIVLAPFLIWLTLETLLKNKRKLWLIAVLGLISASVIFFLSKTFLEQSGNPLALMKYKLGWMAPEGEIIPFYIKNFGFNLFLIPTAIFAGLKKNKKLAIFALVGQVWFILPSLLTLQPWDFDNTKFFIYWYFSSIFIVAYFLSQLILMRRVANIILVMIIIYLVSFAGFLDIARLMTSSGTRYEVYSPASIKVGKFIKENTAQQAVFLSVDKFDNPAVALAGRKVLVGFHGWLWTYGLNYSQREIDVRNMLAGQSNQDLFKKYNISYVILFENEQDNYVINYDFFDQYQLIYNQDGYKIYQI